MARGATIAYLPKGIEDNNMIYSFLCRRPPRSFYLQLPTHYRFSHRSLDSRQIDEMISTMLLLSHLKPGVNIALSREGF
jgi:hypothetical protein